MRYVLNKSTDNDFVEICDVHSPHMNRIGTPIARVVDERLASIMCRALNAERESKISQKCGWYDG
jgi:hypothetical protein